ncbi:MAG: ethylbenzene dehydrogenase-related protein [Thermodesulfobacteriota bacterium]|nr:ethylbenzene dehydrogenase-related protein [Thermodesulfobacteriota bacterium]
MKQSYLIRTMCLIVSLIFIGVTAQAATVLTSVKTDKPILLSGAVDNAWQKAAPLKVTVDNLPYEPNNGYEGMQETTVTMKSLYDDDYLYLLLQYNDPTKSLERFPWIKQEDGSWKQMKNKDSTGHDNTYYEDKVGIFWDINTKGFTEEGCMISCHMDIEGDTSAGRKFTNNPGETIDMWHVKNVRTSPLGQVDDQFMDSTNNGKDNKSFGRKGDMKTGGGYKNNYNKDKTGPAYMNFPPSDKYKYMVVPTLKTPFVDIYKPGDVVPGIVIDAFQGPRADIEMRGKWDNGMWTVEIRRKLVTTGEKAEIQDVQFDDLKKDYSFGIAVFDNSQINHLFHDETLTLKFK